MRKTFYNALSLLMTITCISCFESSELAEDTEGTDTEEVDTGEIGDGDDYVSDVSIEVLNRVKTILVVTWTQVEAADSVWLSFTFENEEFITSHKQSGETGAKREVVLGVPEETLVRIHIVSEVKGSQAFSSAHSGTTGSIPAAMPQPTVESHDESIASPNRWLFGSVDDTDFQKDYYGGPFWLYIIDRKGRIVWYYSDLGNNPIMGFPRVSRTGRHIFFGNRTPWYDDWGFVPTVVKMTLDWEYFEEITIPLADNVDETDDGCLLFNTKDKDFGYGDSWLKEWQPGGKIRDIWYCSAVFGDECYSNTVNWNPLDDTILMSFPYIQTVVEIDRKSGEMVASYGDWAGSYGFDPPTWEFGFQHYANISPEGTLFVSSHMPNSGIRHGFLEFDIDRENRMLRERWYYDKGGEWAEYMGEVHPIPNGEGNVLANYGTGGVIKEITPEKNVAWYVKWDAPFINDDYNKMVGHCTLIDDLYALNRGPE